MYLRLLQLEIKNFFRNPQLGTNLFLKILSILGMLWFLMMMVGLPFLLYFYAKEEMSDDPLKVLSRYFIYYWALDLVMRYFWQQMPTQNVKPFLTMNIPKYKIVNYTIIKTFAHFFNWGNLLFLVPFALLLIVDGGFSILGALMFLIGTLFIFYFNNFLNILLNGKDKVLYAVAGIMVAFGVLEYFGIIKLTSIFEPVFYSLYAVPGAFLIPILLTAVVAYYSYKTISNTFYLDEGLELKKVEGKTENIEFLNQFGVMGTFINNDIRLLKRSKAARSALLMSVLFLFYGLFMFNGAYSDSHFGKLFVSIFVSGGFLFVFGQRVPAWDSTYYPLMMTLNVPYKQYLQGKWSLIVLGTLVSLVLSLAYLYFGWETWLTIFASGLYNLGVNSYITLLAGAFNKQAIDLNSSAKTFGGGKNSFNMKTVLLLIPQMLVPILVYGFVNNLFDQIAAVVALGVLGIIGFLLRNFIFDLIVKVYRTEKYSTLEAFKKIN